MNLLSKLVIKTREHVLAIVFAAFIGSLLIGPELIFMFSSGNQYQGLPLMSAVDETFYLARMHELYDEGKIGNPYLFEHKFQEPLFYSSGGETILALPGKLLNIPVTTLNIIYKFLLPFIEFILIYALLVSLTNKRSWAIAGSLAVFTGGIWYEWEYLKHNIWYALNTGQLADLWYRPVVLNASRPIHPQFSQLLLFLYMSTLYFLHIGGEKVNRRGTLLLGCLLALSFYVYFFSFTFFLAANTTFFIIWWFQNKKDKSKKLFFASSIALLIGSYPLWLIYSAVKDPGYAVIAEKFDVGVTHIPAIGDLLTLPGYLVVIFFCIFAWKMRAEDWSSRIRANAIFIFGLLVTTLIVINQQVITGKVLQIGHYVRSFNNPIYSITLIFILSLLVDYLEKKFSSLANKLNVIPWALSAFFVVSGVFFQYASYKYDAPLAAAKQHYMYSMNWLLNNTEKQSVIMANETLSQLIPIFTSNNVMWEEQDIPAGFIIPAERAQFTPEKILQSEDFLGGIQKYRVDYILWDKERDPDWRIDRFGLPLVFSRDNIEIYKLPPRTSGGSTDDKKDSPGL